MFHSIAWSIDRKGMAICAAMLLLYAAVIFATAAVPWPSALIGFAQILISTAVTWLIVGLLALGAMTFSEIRKGSDQVAHRLIVARLARGWKADRYMALVWPVVLYAMLLTLFAIFKQRVLPLAGFRYDELFHSADLALFGTEPWRLSHSSPWLTEVFGHLYYGWYAPMLLGTLGCAFVVANPAFRQRYLTAFVMTWLVVGSLMAFLLPAAGPCYWSEFVPGYNPYAPLMESLRSDVAGASTYNPVLDIQAYLLNNFGGPKISIGGGISAMPSMHVALATIFTCGAWSLHKGAGILFAAFGLAIWWASIHLGWHYAVDGLVAAPAALVIWYLSGLLFPTAVAHPNPESEPGALEGIKLAGNAA